MGHLMRCIALVEHWVASGAEVVAVVDRPSLALSRAIEAAGAAVYPIAVEPASPEDAIETVRIARSVGAPWIVADGYSFGESYQRWLRTKDVRLVVIDDHGSRTRHHADLLVDQNLGSRAGDYAGGRYDGQLIVGSRYALIRKEFTTTTAEPTVTNGTRVVVTLGGGRGSRVDAVAADMKEQLTGSVDVATPLGVGFGPPGVMADLLRSATVAVSAAGVTAWELSYLGVPAVLVAVADNQVPVGVALDQAGAAVYLGQLDTLSEDDLTAAVTQLLADPTRREAMAARGRALIDGLGATRVITRLRAPLVSLRPVVTADAQLLWEWANDPVVRSQSFSSDPIGWEDHVTWMERRLSDPECCIYLAEDEDGPWGQIRFEALDRATAEVGVSIAVQARGQHRAAPLIRAGVERLFRESAFSRLRARVKHDNEASRSAFLAADFDECDEDVADGYRTLRYTQDRGA